MYDPKTGKITLISTCFPTHHLVFAEDANNTLWTSAGGPGSGVIGWLNRKMFEETGDEVKSQGWTALVLDTNGNGKRDEYVEPNQPVDPTKDKRVTAGFYGVAVNPADGTIWGSVLGFPGYVIRLDPGSNPPATALAEVFEPPLPGYGPRGMDIDRSGVVWTPLSSGHMASFDRRKCKGPLNGPNATGKHCPEGWTLHPFPGPQFANVSGVRQRRVELLHVGGSVRHVRARQGRADRHGERQRVAAGARERPVRQPARPVSAGLLREVDGRAHRRSECRVEGQRPVGHRVHENAVPHGRRQGDDEQGRQVPVASRIRWRGERVGRPCGDPDRRPSRHGRLLCRGRRAVEYLRLTSSRSLHRRRSCRRRR